jgi:protein arginine kinase activator
MNCQLCGQPANVHLTNIINKKKQEMHLCEACARAEKLLPEGNNPQINLQALVQMVLGETPEASAEVELHCPECGLEYNAFRADGRLGCSHDYDVFREPLEPLLERIHRCCRYVGKTPVSASKRAELSTLKKQLKSAIENEHYEDAARLRDLIREKEGADEPR